MYFNCLKLENVRRDNDPDIVTGIKFAVKDLVTSLHVIWILPREFTAGHMLKTSLT